MPTYIDAARTPPSPAPERAAPQLATGDVVQAAHQGGPLELVGRQRGTLRNIDRTNFLNVSEMRWSNNKELGTPAWTDAYQDELPLQVKAAPAISTTTTNGREEDEWERLQDINLWGAQREPERIASSYTDFSLIDDLGAYEVEFSKQENTMNRINKEKSETAYEDSFLQGTQSMITTHNEDCNIANNKLKKEILKR